MFCDLRDSTDILQNFEQDIYRGGSRDETKPYTYKEFLLDVHETSYNELYLGHENTFSEIYGDGVLAIFPEDNTKYILENVYRLTKRVRIYNEADGTEYSSPESISVSASPWVRFPSFIILWTSATIPLAYAFMRLPG